MRLLFRVAVICGPASIRIIVYSCWYFVNCSCIHAYLCTIGTSGQWCSSSHLSLPVWSLGKEDHGGEGHGYNGAREGVQRRNVTLCSSNMVRYIYMSFLTYHP